MFNTQSKCTSLEEKLLFPAPCCFSSSVGAQSCLPQPSQRIRLQGEQIPWNKRSLFYFVLLPNGKGSISSRFGSSAFWCYWSVPPCGQHIQTVGSEQPEGQQRVLLLCPHLPMMAEQEMGSLWAAGPQHHHTWLHSLRKGTSPCTTPWTRAHLKQCISFELSEPKPGTDKAFHCSVCGRCCPTCAPWGASSPRAWSLCDPVTPAESEPDPSPELPHVELCCLALLFELHPSPRSGD